LATVGSAKRADQDTQLRDRWAAAMDRGNPSYARIAKEAGVSVPALKGALAGQAQLARPGKRSAIPVPALSNI
jgi:hypothetical protein